MISKMHRRLNRATRLVRDCAGTAAVEMGILGPVFCFIIMGVVDLGRAFWWGVQVKSAVEAGTSYAVKTGFNSTAIQAAVRAASNQISATPAPSQFCGCPDAVSGITTTTGTAPTCTAACASGGTAGVYAKIGAQVSYAPFFRWPQSIIPTTIAAQTIVRLK